jgi:hypothetical protein
VAGALALTWLAACSGAGSSRLQIAGDPDADGVILGSIEMPGVAVGESWVWGAMPVCATDGPVEITDVTTDSPDGSIIVKGWAVRPWGSPGHFANAQGTLADNGIDSPNHTESSPCSDEETNDEFVAEVALAEGFSRGESERFVLTYRSGLYTGTLRIGLGAILDTAGER